MRVFRTQGRSEITPAAPDLMDVDYFDIEVESLAGERVIKVKKDSMVFDLLYYGLNDATTRIRSSQLHADLDVFRNFLLRQLMQRGQISDPVTVRRCHDHLLGFPDRHPLYRRFDATNNLMSALCICQRGFPHIRLDDLVVVQLKSVLERNHFAF